MRIKRSVTARARHNKVKKATKGMLRSRRTSYRLGKQATIRALQHSYRDRRNRKRDFKRLWIQRINQAARANGLTYSSLMNALKKANVKLDRKVLSQIAVEEPQVFTELTKISNK